ATIDAAGNRQPFAGKLIPAARQNGPAQKMLSFYPDPNRVGIANNFYSQSSSRPVNNGYSIRIDHRLSDRHNLFGRISWNRFRNQLANNYGNPASPNAGIDNRINRSLTIDDGYLVGGWMLHVNLGYAYHSNPRYSPADEITAASLGMPAKIDAVAQFHIFPRVEPSGYGAMGGDPTFTIGNK